MFGRGFFRENANLLVAAYTLFDILVFALMGVICYIVLPLQVVSVESYLLAGIIATLLFVLASYVFGWYSPQRGSDRMVEVRQIAMGITSVYFAGVLLMFLTKTSSDYSRLWTTSWFVSGTIAVIFLRILLRSLLSAARSAGFNLRHVVVFSSESEGHRVLEEVELNPQSGYRIVGYFSDEPDDLAAAVASVECTGSLDDGVEFVSEKSADQVWLAMPLSAEESIRILLGRLSTYALNVRLIPDFFGYRLINHSISQIGELSVVDLSMSPMDGANRLIKEIEDKLLASFILLIISPVLLFLAVGVKLSSPGPIFYRQERVSWNGKPFQMYKFRSMPINAEQSTGAVWATSGDDRATGFGAFIRRTSLDELPQFWNVLKGDMSIVGPRPERPMFVEQFKDEIPGYMQKHMVKAGLPAGPRSMAGAGIPT